jgi:hypothetical protein
MIAQVTSIQAGIHVVVAQPRYAHCTWGTMSPNDSKRVYNTDVSHSFDAGKLCCFLIAE